MRQPPLFSENELPPRKPEAEAARSAGKPERAPTEAEWRTLVNTAVRFRDLKCWDWMLDCDLFGVRDPETEVTGYCCIMGNLGQVFALLVYLGTNGLNGYFKLIEAPAAERKDPYFVYSIHDCLRLEFENKSGLRPDEKQTLKELRLEFTGRKQWPSFSRMRPGYVPWTISGSEARFLTVVLEQAVEVAREFKANPKLLDPPREGVFMVRQFSTAGAGRTWSSEWQEPAPPEPRQIPYLGRELWLAVKKDSLPRAGSWECDLFYPGETIHERKEDPPYFARCSMLVEHDSGIVLSTELGRPEEGILTVQKALVGAFEKIGAVPEEILYRGDDVCFALGDAAEVLGIRLTRVKKLPELDNVRRDLAKWMGRR